MEVEPEPPAEEIKRLQRSVNDLVSVLALPAIWIGVEPSKIVRSLLDALIGMLRLDLVYVRLKDPIGIAPIEMARTTGSRTPAARPQEIGALLGPWLEADPQLWPERIQNPEGDGELSIEPLRLGLLGEIGIIVAGSRRTDFPRQTEKLILSVAANQAAIGLQGARLLSEQKRVANDLDQRVAQRTEELAAANEELRRSEAFLAEAQRLSSTGSFSWRVATDEIIWSEQLYRIFEFDQSTPVTLEQIRSRIHPDDIPLLGDMIERARAGGGDFEYEHRLRMPDGSVKHVHLIAHATRDKDGALEYIGAAQDVTRRRLSEAALAKARSELAHVARITSLGVLTASIAHEVNQPLAAIVTNGQTGLRWLNRPEPNIGKARELTERVVADARRASEIIDRIRAMAAGRAPEQTLLSLDDVVEQALIFLRHEFQSKSTSVSLEPAPALPQVVGDRTQLQQVIVNLAINAVQAMAQSGSARRIICVRTMPSDPASVCCLIEDSGPGIDPAHLPHLFDTFFTTKDAGMGMGLPISRSIIEAHGGRIRADNDSTLGGARFRFELPCQL